jgi:hypothetical protein
MGARYKIFERFNIGWVDLYNPDTFNTFYIESSTHFKLFDVIDDFRVIIHYALAF